MNKDYDDIYSQMNGNLALIIEKAIEMNGKDFIIHPCLFHILNDYHAFDSSDQYRFIFKVIQNDKDFVRLIKTSNWEFDSKSYATNLAKKTGIHEPLIKDILKVIGYGLGYIKHIEDFVLEIQYKIESTFPHKDFIIDGSKRVFSKKELKYIVDCHTFMEEKLDEVPRYMLHIRYNKHGIENFLNVELDSVSERRFPECNTTIDPKDVCIYRALYPDWKEERMFCRIRKGKI